VIVVSCTALAGSTPHAQPDPLAAERQRLANALARHHHDGDVGVGCAEMEDAWNAFAAAGGLTPILAQQVRPQCDQRFDARRWV
jgi:hypothetical protein